MICHTFRGSGSASSCNSWAVGRCLIGRRSLSRPRIRAAAREEVKAVHPYRTAFAVLGMLSSGSPNRVRGGNARPTRQALRHLFGENDGCLFGLPEPRGWSRPPVIQQPLTLYRLHFIDRRTGTIDHTYEFHAEDDAAAIQFATVWSEYAPMELRSRRRRVMWWPASSNDR